MSNQLTPYEYINFKYQRLCSTYSDIYEHLPTLSRYASQCNSVFETGVRGVISSWAFLHGLTRDVSNMSSKSLFLNDIVVCNIQEIQYICQLNNFKLEYQWKNNLELEFEESRRFDMTFIDTWHIYGQLKRELEKFSKITNKYIALHDTTIDAEYGESIRLNHNILEMSKKSGFSVEEIIRGLWKAVEEFLETHPDWKLKERFTNNNGLTILEYIGKEAEGSSE